MNGPSEPTARAGAITRDEWRWAVWASLAVMGLTCLPYLFGWFITPPGYHYMGLLANPDEHNVYLGWMRQVLRGELLFHDPFTTEPQPARFFLGFFLALGLAARGTHIPPIWVYHVARVICGALLLVAVYALAAQLCERRFTRRLAWAFAAFSSGLGWLYALAAPGATVHPIDYGPRLVMPEAITFLTLLLNPMFACSVALLAAMWAAYLAAVRADSWRLAALGGAAALMLGNVHTYDVFPAWLTLAAYVVAAGIIGRRMPVREMKFAALIAVMAAPFVAYQYWVFQTNVVFHDKAVTLKLTPPLAHFAAGFGLVLALAIPGGVMALRRRSPAQALPVIWAVVTLLLVFLTPVSFQRKLAEGVHIPLCLLAASFVGEWAAPRMSRSAALALAVLLVAAACPSNVFFMARGARDLMTNNRAYLRVLMPPLYLRADTVEAMTWLRENTRMEQGVMCASLEGSYVPGVAGNTVFVGHWDETLHYPRKLKQVVWFFSAAASPPQRRELMADNGLRFVLYTEYERALGVFDPAGASDFEAVFVRPQAALFRLVPE
jgi:hypothetical protein